MPQHFLLSVKSRTLSVRKVMELTGDHAFALFKEVRRVGGEEVACRMCGGVIHEHYFIATCKQWRCKDCAHTFSVMFGKIFAFHKLPLRAYLAAIAIYTSAVKGITALQLARDLGVQYATTTCVLAHKIRESVMAQREL